MSDVLARFAVLTCAIAASQVLWHYIKPLLGGPVRLSGPSAPPRPRYAVTDVEEEPEPDASLVGRVCLAQDRTMWAVVRPGRAHGVSSRLKTWGEAIAEGGEFTPLVPIADRLEVDHSGTGWVERDSRGLHWAVINGEPRELGTPVAIGDVVRFRGPVHWLPTAAEREQVDVPPPGNLALIEAWTPAEALRWFTIAAPRAPMLLDMLGSHQRPEMNQVGENRAKRWLSTLGYSEDEALTIIALVQHALWAEAPRAERKAPAETGVEQ